MLNKEELREVYDEFGVVKDKTLMNFKEYYQYCFEVLELAKQGKKHPDKKYMV